MEIEKYLKILERRRGTVLVFVLVFLIVAAAASLSQPLKYRSTSRLLIIQNGATAADPYAVAKSNQYLSSLFSEAVSSGSFFELLNANASDIDWSYFSGDYKTQIKKWKQTVSATNVNDTGVMEIYVYHTNTTQAKQINLAINNAIINQNSNYQSNANVGVKVIDQPTISSYPVKPNLPLNLGASLIFGLIAGLMYIYYFPYSRREKKAFSLSINAMNKRANTPANPSPANLPIEENYAQPGYAKPQMNETPYHQNQSFNNQNNHQDNNPNFHGNIRNIIGN